MALRGIKTMKPPQALITREEWLLKAVEEFKASVFKRANYNVPTVKVSVGLPRGRSRAIGQHWSPEASDDNLGSVFISPTLECGVEVLATLVHEMVHAAVGNAEKHGKAFKRCALAVGLCGKMTATEAGEGLKSDIQAVIERIGAYPHKKLNLKLRPTGTQGTRMLKVSCHDCGYILRATRTVLEGRGAPICPCNGEGMKWE